MEKYKVGMVLHQKWHLDTFLGKGGMADVFAATHRNGSRGAVKILHPWLAADPTLRQRLIREGYLSNKVGHPGAVRVLDDHEGDDGVVYMVMELLDGDSLRAKWLRAGKRLDPFYVADVARQVLDVLAAAHARSIVHRDVKPDNVFVTDEGSIKLLDFGIARIAEEATGLARTQSGMTLGTPAFMSPEQARSEWDKVNARSDLFSLGATMWMLITGKKVHEAGGLVDTLIAAGSTPAQKISEVDPTVPKGIAAVIDRALAFENDKRWPSANDMILALDGARAMAKAGGTLRLNKDTIEMDRPPVPEVPPATSEADASPDAAGVDGESADAETAHGSPPPMSSNDPFNVATEVTGPPAEIVEAKRELRRRIRLPAGDEGKSATSASDWTRPSELPEPPESVTRTMPAVRRSRTGLVIGVVAVIGIGIGVAAWLTQRSGNRADAAGVADARVDASAPATPAGAAPSASAASTCADPRCDAPSDAVGNASATSASAAPAASIAKGPAPWKAWPGRAPATPSAPPPPVTATPSAPPAASTAPLHL